jgi:hypothetical protein
MNEERPLHDYIDMEAYDVVSGDTYRDLSVNFDSKVDELREREKQCGALREVLNMCARSNHGKAIELGLSDRNFEDCGDPTCMEARKLLGDSHG